MALGGRDTGGQAQERGAGGAGAAAHGGVPERGSPSRGRNECSLHMVDVKGFAGVLQALKSGGKQVCAVTIAQDGLRVQWEDESKTLQCSVFLPAEVFSSFTCGPGVRHTFGLQLSVLLDTLSLFASAPSIAGLQLRYPGPNGELICGMSSEVIGVPGQTCKLTTYARLGAVELPQSRDLTDFWQHPTSSFISQGLLREVVEDLEWPVGDVQLTLCAEPKQRLLLRAAGVAGHLQIEVPMESLVDFTVVPPQDTGNLAGGGCVEHMYKYKALKAAFCDLLMARAGVADRQGGGAPGGGGSSGGARGSGVAPKVHEASTKVFVDANGMLKVTHMVAMATGAALEGWQQHVLRGMHMQAGGERNAVITFVTVPVLEGE